MKNASDSQSIAPAARAVFDRAAERAPHLSRTTAEERIELIRRLAQTVLGCRSEIYRAVRTERGLGQVDVDGELLMVKSAADCAARHLKHWVKDQPVDPSLMTLGKKSYVHYEAKGVVLHLATWNAPYAISFVPVIGALAAGNAVVIKPSELAPGSSTQIARIVAKAFPDGEVQVIEGGAETAQALLECPFDHIVYVGNTRIGKLVMRAAAEHCASVTLEMGGKNPSIVGPSADIADTAMKTAWGRMCNGGQACIAPDYVLVHHSIERAFVEALVKEFSAQYNPDGRGYAANPDYPVMINQRHFERVRGLIEDARDKGATIVCGGEYVVERKLITPTLITGVTNEMMVVQEEAFGPVLCVMSWRDREAAARAVRGPNKPLALYIFSKDREEIDYFIAHTTAGSTAINHNVVQSGINPALPFGGANTSGIGRLGGWYTFNECSNARGVVEEGPLLGDPRMFVAPATDKFKRQVASLLTSRPVPPGLVKAFHAMVRLRSAL